LNSIADSPVSAVSLSSSQTVNGGYVAAGVGLRNLGYGTVSIAGIPAGSSVAAAYLIWDILDNSQEPSLATGAFDGNAISGQSTGVGATPCWPAAANFGYIANVTPFVTGNGQYQLSGFASGEADGGDPWLVGTPVPEAEGASLIVVYTNSADPATTVQVYTGAQETPPDASATLSGFTVSAAAAASTTFIVADGQNAGSHYGDFDGQTVTTAFSGAAPIAGGIPYSQGDLWDTDTVDVSNVVAPGDTSATVTVGAPSDCLVWVGQVLAVSANAVQAWQPTDDPQNPFAQAGAPNFSPGTGVSPFTIAVNSDALGQEMAGFGGTMTDSSAYELDANRDSAGNPILPDVPSPQTLQSLFSPTTGIGLDYIRVPIGGNDFSQTSYSSACNQNNARCSSSNNYTEDDVSSNFFSELLGDSNFTHFSLAPDEAYLIPTLQAALKINPNIQFLASPWTAPAWMKCGTFPFACIPGEGTLDGGTLNGGWTEAYAQYLLKVIEAYAAQGITFAGITLDNEPFNTNADPDYPVMPLSLSQQEAIANDIGPLLRRAGLTTQILGIDHNWNYAGDASSLVGSAAGKYISGIAFHCYGGDPDQQLSVSPSGEPIYETECSPQGSYSGPSDLSTSPASYSADLVYNTLQEVIQSVQYGSRSVMLYNIAANANYGPTINTGCYGTRNNNCLPLEGVNASGSATPDVGYYTLGDVSRFLQPRAYKIYSTLGGDGTCPAPPGDKATGEPPYCVWSVAFQNPDGGIVLVVLNISPGSKPFAVEWDGESFTTSIPGDTVRTYIWNGSSRSSPTQPSS
jgi:glucosylceramidase